MLQIRVSLIEQSVIFVKQNDNLPVLVRIFSYLIFAYLIREFLHSFWGGLWQVRQLLSQDPRNSEYADMEKELKEVIDHTSFLLNLHSWFCVITIFMSLCLSPLSLCAQNTHNTLKQIMLVEHLGFANHHVLLCFPFPPSFEGFSILLELALTSFNSYHHTVELGLSFVI